MLIEVGKLLGRGEICKVWMKIDDLAYKVNKEIRRKGVVSVTVRNRTWMARAVTTGLCLDAGLRPSEIVRLRWRHVTLMDDSQARLQINSVEGGYALGRDILASGRLSDLLRLWQRIRWSGFDVEGSPVVVNCAYSKTAMTTRTVQRYVAQATEAYLGEARTAYDLRHSFACQLLRVASQEVVQHALGHRTKASVRGYATIQAPDVSDAIAAMEKATQLMNDERRRLMQSN